MADSVDSYVRGLNHAASRQSSIPIKSTYLQSSRMLDNLSPNEPSMRFSLNAQWKIDKLPTGASNASLDSSTTESDWRLESEPPWTRITTEEPLSPELRAEVREDLVESYYFGDMEDYRRNLKACWRNEGFFMSITGSTVHLESSLLNQLCNKLTPFYWMPSAELNGSPLPLLPFGCIFKEWSKYHSNEPNIKFGNFFAHLVRVYPTGPTTIQGIVEAHRTLCTEAGLLLGRIDRGEAQEFFTSGGGSWRQPRKYRLKPTYRAIITILDRYIYPHRDGEFIEVEQHSKNQTVLLVRTRDESHLSAPINFDALRADGLCLPLEITSVLAASGDVVRVSLANAVKFIVELGKREDATSSQSAAILERERKANAWADKELKEADEKGIDNNCITWEAVRRVKAARMGEVFAKREPYPFNRCWK